MSDTLNHLAAMRRRLVSAAVDVRAAKLDLEAIKATAEQDVYTQALAAQADEPAPIDAKGKLAKRPHPLGENEQDRNRALAVGLGNHAGYSAALARLETAERRHKELEAELEILLDTRRESEWKTRADLVRVLELRAINRDGGQDHGGTFSTEILDDAATGELAGAASYEPPF